MAGPDLRLKFARAWTSASGPIPAIHGLICRRGSCRSLACIRRPRSQIQIADIPIPVPSWASPRGVDKSSAAQKYSIPIPDLRGFRCVGVQTPRIGARIFGVKCYRNERLTMPKFVTIGYGDRRGYDSTETSIRDAAHVHDARLLEAGAVMGVAGTPVQVRNPDATKIETLNAPFMTSSLPVAGFTVIEAKDLEEAVTMMSKTPCAVAHGVVEVWPLEEARQA